MLIVKKTGFFSANMLNSQSNLLQTRVIVQEFKHPKALKVFVITEMWERYGFYVVQTLLALFLALKFKWPDIKVYYLVASFTALNYLSPLVGGWVADHLIGQKRAILYGAFVLFLSYISLSFMHNELTLLISLAAIPVGTGLLKPNISSLLGHQYRAAPSQRESGFTIFYMGLAAGIILGTTLPSIISPVLTTCPFCTDNKV